MLTNDDLKRYSVIVGDGSGCLFQPMTTSYTYVVTARHLFHYAPNERYPHNTITKPNGTQIPIWRQVLNGQWREVQIDFVLENNANYFEHPGADIAILKIPYQEGFNQITVQDRYEADNGFSLCGFPNTHRNHQIGDKYSSFNIESFGATGNFSHQARLSGNLQLHNVEGTSGCGILKLNCEGISIIGIQSKMGALDYPAGSIGFVPLKYAREIIDSVNNHDKLAKLFPNTLTTFAFLKDKAFILDVDEMDLENATDIRTTLLIKAQKIVASDITPFGIRELFKSRLLMSERDDECLSFSSLWIAWLEFLTIMNLMKYEPISSHDLSSIFNSYRLKYVSSGEWTEKNLRSEYGKSDYLGMPPNSTVIVSSSIPAKTTFKIPRGKLIDISRPYDKSGFKADQGIDPFTSFDFVHIDYFKTKCIVQQIEQFKNLGEEEIINKLKDQYNELFN